MRKDINYRGIDLQVSNKGRIYYKSNGEELEQFQIGNNPYLMCQAYNPVTRRAMLLNVGRIVCMAFHPIEGEDYKNLQADHIDSNPTRNVPSNLRWMTRKQNNSRKHAKMMREKNRKLTSHSREYVKAVNEETGEVKYYKNGKQASIALGCSSPFVYMALTGKARSVFGWTLTYISRDSEEARELTEKLAADNEKKASKKIQKMCEQREKTTRRKAMLLRMIARHVTEQERREFAKELHKVLQLSKNGEVVNEYINPRQATIATGLKGIRKAVDSGNEGAEVGGFIWKYKIEREVNEI